MTVEEFQAEWFPPLKATAEDTERAIIKLDQEVDRIVNGWQPFYTIEEVSGKPRIKECRT